MKLTDQTCKNAKPKEKPYKLADGEGLYLEITPKGAKLWRLKYRYLNKEKKLCIGPYPLITLAEARERRQEAKRRLLSGSDPSMDKKATKKTLMDDMSNTFETIAREWHEHKKAEWSETNANVVIERLEKDVFPVIGKYPVKHITPKMILDLANKAKERGAKELAKRIIQTCKNIFQYAVVTGRAESNVAADLKGLIKTGGTTHHAAIESKDLPQFMADLREHKTKLNRQTYLAVYLMMLTFVRTGELIKAEWPEIDFEARQWIIPAKRMKMKKDHIVPLSRQSIQILQELREIHSHPDFVFPSRNSNKNHMSNNTILMALDRMGYRGKMTGHGFRALAMSTIMEKLGYRHEVPDAQLAHAKKGDVNRAYDRAKFLEERIVMMQRWADYLDNNQINNIITANFIKG